MALVNYTFTSLLNADSGGQNTVASEAVEVRFQFDATLATIYSDSAGASPIAQPGAATDANGILSFWALPGYYTITAASRTENVVIDDGSRLNPLVLSDAQANIKNLKLNEVFEVVERTSGNGGGAKWKVIAKTTENGFDIVTGDATRSLQLIVGSYGLSVKQFGAIGDGVTDDTLALQRVLDVARTLASASDFLYVKVILDDGVYLTTAPLIIYAYGIRVSGYGAKIRNTSSLVLQVGNFLVQRGPEDQLQSLIEDVLFDGVDGAILSFINNNNCVLLDRVTSPQFSRCTFWGFNIAVDSQGAILPRFRQCQFRANRLAINARTLSGRFSNFLHFNDCLFIENIRLTDFDGGALSLYRCTAESSNPNATASVTLHTLLNMSGSAAAPSAIFDQYHSEISTSVREIYFTAASSDKSLVIKESGLVANGNTSAVVQIDSGKINISESTLFSGAGGVSFQGAVGVSGTFTNVEATSGMINIDNITFINNGNITHGGQTTDERAFFTRWGGVFNGGIDTTTAGRLQLHSKSATWFLETSGILRPSVDDSYDIGSGTLAVKMAFLKKIAMTTDSAVFDSAGSGTPEGVIAASVGSTYRRTNGGAGTSFYVKESGTGNTGWVAK